MNSLPAERDKYSILLKRIKQEIAQGLDRAQRAYAREKVITYWKIGQAISKHLLENKERADYGKQLYARLSRDLDIGERLLYQMSQFYNTYPDLTPLQNLKWSHYRLLTSVKDAEQRNILATKAESDNWSKRALETFIKDDKEKSAKAGKPKLTKPAKLSLFKGRLYTYGIFKDPCTENILIDCGFNVYYESDMATYSGALVETVKTGNIYKLVKSNATLKHLYTYKAYVKKIVDGDTLWVTIDCGFRIWLSQKIRLRGIDTPGITTQQGLEAYKFVCNELKGLPFIIIKSHGRDKYDRYLSDIFYLRGEEDPTIVLEKGNFLNQRLLDESLAIRETT
jgi:endonuclease YncB( thermonuclease family)